MYSLEFSLLLNINAILKNVETKQLLVLSDVHSIFLFLSKSMWTSNCLVVHLLQNTLFCVQHKKEMNTGLGQHESE